MSRRSSRALAVLWAGITIALHVSVPVAGHVIRPSAPGSATRGPVALGMYTQLAAPHAERLSPDQLRGKGIFLQRCSLCHLPQLPGRRAPFGPLLTGVLKDATPAQVSRLRDKVLNGSTGMPAFKYGLEPKEIDDLLTYVRTL